MVVLGSLNLDLVAHVKTIPVQGETVAGIGYEENLGGKGANQAVGAARLGSAVQMIGRIGNDSYGEKLLAGLRDAGVDTTSVLAAQAASGMAIILHEAHGANAIVVHAGANAALTPREVMLHAALIEGAGILLLQLESPIESVLLAAQIANANGVPVVLDPAPAQSLPAELFACTTWLTPNETEARTLLGRTEGSQTDEDVAKLLALGCRNVALKLGERGAFLSGADCEDTSVSAYSVEAADTTAAGDCFNAAFASRLLLGDKPKQAAQYANAAAAVCVTRHGAQAAMPTVAEVEEFLSRR
jgi:ribokinase